MNKLLHQDFLTNISDLDWISDVLQFTVFISVCSRPCLFLLSVHILIYPSPIVPWCEWAGCTEGSADAEEGICAPDPVWGRPGIIQLNPIWLQLW